MTENSAREKMTLYMDFTFLLHDYDSVADKFMIISNHIDDKRLSIRLSSIAYNLVG